MARPLSGVRVALPETRELELLAQMLEAEGASIERCPLVDIVDPPDGAPVAAWLGRFIAVPPDDLILLTGEGLRRLAAAAARLDRGADFVAALASPRKIIRGPKPAAALRELGLEPDLRAKEPTTAGVIAALTPESLAGRRVGVQLYPDNPNTELLDFLSSAGARTDPVLPYAYATKESSARVIELIDMMAAGNLQVVAFTSSSQVRRLFDVARSANRETELRLSLAQMKVAAVGPLVVGTLATHGVSATIAPAKAYNMKPLVRAIVQATANT
jgi:uroporphyrinogen-III synthase